MSCEDQACVPTKVCRQCRTGFDADGKPIFAPLVIRGRFWCCSNCGASYGENPHPDLNGCPHTWAYQQILRDHPSALSSRDNGNTNIRTCTRHGCGRLELKTWTQVMSVDEARGKL